MIIQIPQHYNQIALQFALDSFNTSTDEYARRNQNDASNIIQQIQDGKMAEFGVLEICKLLGLIIKREPDIKVYTKHKKSYACDLETDMLNLHVKTQNVIQSKQYGKSWVFQKNDPLFNSYTDADHVVLTQISHNLLNIVHWLPFKSVINSFDEPKKSELAVTKTVLYHENIVKNLQISS